MTLTPKGTVILRRWKNSTISKKITIAATGTTGTVNYDVITQAVLSHNKPAGNFTVNIRGDGSKLNKFWIERSQLLS